MPMHFLLPVKKGHSQLPKRPHRAGSIHTHGPETLCFQEKFHLENLSPRAPASPPPPASLPPSPGTKACATATWSLSVGEDVRFEVTVTEARASPFPQPRAFSLQWKMPDIWRLSLKVAPGRSVLQSTGMCTQIYC